MDQTRRPHRRGKSRRSVEETPLRLMPPTIIPMTVQQEKLATEALAELIRPIVVRELRRLRRAA